MLFLLVLEEDCRIENYLQLRNMQFVIRITIQKIVDN
jgi:hypothetical protein